MDSIIQHRLHIYPHGLCEIFYFIAIDNWVMFELTGLNYHSIIPHQHMKKSMHIGANCDF